MLTRIPLTRTAIGALTLLASTTATAQQSPRGWELRIPSGVMVATGAQRQQLKDAQSTGAQLSYRVRPGLAVQGSFNWARSRDLATAGTPKLDVFTSDLGVETRSAEWQAGPVSLSAFAGIGGGMRSYNYRKLDVDATDNLAGYGAVGGELGMGRVAMRIEARDYATGFKPLVGAGESVTRNDVMITAAFRFNRRVATEQE